MATPIVGVVLKRETVIVEEEIHTKNYIKIRTKSEIDDTVPGKTRNDMEKWCIRNQCGKRVSMFHFAFKTDAEYTMFKLRWL